VIVAAVVVAAIIIGGVLQARSLGGGPSSPAVSTGVAPSERAASASPAAAPLVEDVPASCPASSSAVIHPAFRPAAGNGPVYMNLGLHPVAGQRTLSYHGADWRQNVPPGFGGQNVIFLVAPSYQQPITLSVAALEPSGGLQADWPAEVLLPADTPSQIGSLAPGQAGYTPIGVTADGWRMYSHGVVIRLDRPGCYVINLTGPGLAERITFWATLQTVTPTPTPTGPKPTPKPPTEWMPFVRMLGRSYLAAGWGGTNPPLSLDPSFAGRQVGTVLWNVMDPSTDLSYASRDGSSAILAAGTPVYALKGYREDFRLLAETDYGWRVFETDGLNGAKTIGDALDIRGKVVSVEARTDGVSGFQTVLGKVTQPDRVSSLVDLLLAQPVTSPTKATWTSPFPELQLIFRLNDGTLTVKELYVGDCELSQGIPVTQEFFSRVEAAFTGAS